MKKSYLNIAVIIFLTVVVSCKKEKEVVECTTTEKELLIPEFYGSNPIGSADPDYTTIANSTNQVNSPQDLDFHPNATRRGELWILNEGTQNSGSTTIIITDAGKSTQSSVYRKDGNSWHFMSMSTALAFSPENDNFGTTSNENGFFFFKNIDSTKTVIFSTPGYITKKIKYYELLWST